jgi:ribonuclease J
LNLTIYRGSHEIGGTLIELKTDTTRVLIDAGYPLFLNGQPIADDVAKLPAERLLELGVLPPIKELYAWDKPGFDAVVISHAHVDHYGLLKYVHPEIPIWLSAGTKALIEISQVFKIYDSYPLNARVFKMYEPFEVGDISVKPYLMDHSAFDAAAFEVRAGGKTVIYSGDFRGHGRKAVCLDSFIKYAPKGADMLLTEGTMFGRQGEEVRTEEELEGVIAERIKATNGPVLFQCSSQNIDRIVTFYRAALRSRKTFVVDVYTANVLYTLRNLGNNQVPYPSEDYPAMKVFYPWRVTQRVFHEIGEEYAKRFSPYYIPKAKLKAEENNVVMLARPSMYKDIEIAGLKDGLFIYSMWQGYRGSEYQKKFEAGLAAAGFAQDYIHTSGHARVEDIRRMMAGLAPKRIVPIHTMNPEAFANVSDVVTVAKDGKEIEV